MAVGGTKISGGAVTPSVGETGVVVDLANLIHEGVMRQWFDGIDPPMPAGAGWYTGNFLDIVSIANIVFHINPAHSTDAASYIIDPYETGAEQQFRVTIPSAANFVGSTGYTWSLTMSITHGTFDEGVVTRSYDTTEQIVAGTSGDLAPAMTFTTEASVPLKPTNPTPEDTDTEVDFSDYTISWEDGGGADSYNIYFGDSETPVFLGNQEETSIEVPYTTETDEEGVIHAYVNGTEINWNVPFYWRIDAVNDVGTTTGDVWSFDARPIKVTNPEPEDVGEAPKLFPEYSWDASTVATSYDLYIGIDELAGLHSIDVPGLDGTSYDSAVVGFQNGYIWGYNCTYHWRVDAANEFGIAEGDEWTFASISYEPPLPTGITLSDDEGEPGGGEGTPTGTPTGENNMITVQRLVVAANNKLFYEDE